MTWLLAGDIGGTKTILRLVEVVDGRLATQHQAYYASHEYVDLVPLVEQFLAAATAKLGNCHPETACFGIAGPVEAGNSKLTNLAWSLSESRLSHELGIKSVTLINDFAAIGYGILGLEAADLHTLQAGQPDMTAPIAIIGAGTGLGQGFLISQNSERIIYGSEGGHADFAPKTELEFQLSRYLLERYQVERISVERVVSGRGIVTIYQFLRDREFATESPEIAEAVRTSERELGREEKTVNPAAMISAAAIAQQDALSEQTMRIFIEAYGAEAGNLALKLLPNAGLYIAGGIAAKNLPLLERGEFIEAFLSKGRMRSLLQKVPIYVVLNPEVGLLGAAICAARSLKGLALQS
jgi:glucokinase